jgi:hypothetical protein
MEVLVRDLVSDAFHLHWDAATVLKMCQLDAKRYNKCCETMLRKVQAAYLSQRGWKC